MVLFPLIHYYSPERSSALLSMTIAWIGLVLVLAASWMRADAPRVSEVFYLADLEANRFYRASPQRALDGWADSVLRSDGHAPRRIGDQPFFENELWVADARPARLRHSAIVIEQANAEGRLEFRLRSVNGGRRLQLLIKPAVDLGEARLDGRLANRLRAPGPASEPGRGATFYFTLPGLTSKVGS